MASSSRGQPQFCRNFDRVASLYPLNPSGAPAKPQDLIRIFHPTNGELAKVAESLAGSIEKRGSRWEFVPGARGVNRNFLDFYSRATQVAGAMFDPQGEGPKFEFVMKRLAPSTGTSEVVLSIDGRSMTRTQSNTSVVQVFNWASDEARTASASRSLTAGGTKIPGLEYAETWGIFRLFGRARWERVGSDESYRLTWEVGEGRTYVVDGQITFTKGSPVLHPGFLSSLRCPR